MAAVTLLLLYLSFVVTFVLTANVVLIAGGARGVFQEWLQSAWAQKTYQANAVGTETFFRQ